LVLVLAVTGILINHTDALRLDRRYVTSAALQSWFGVSAPDTLVSYPAGDAWISQIEDRVYFNKREIGNHYPRLLGAVALDRDLVVGMEDRFLLLDAQGDLMEDIPAQPDLQRVGNGHGRLVVRAARAQLATDRELRYWKPDRQRDVRWSTPAVAPAALTEDIRRQYRNKMLSAERVVRDIHNGSIFGRAGYLVMDAAAVSFIGLALSGAWLWLRRWRNDRENAKKRAKPAG